MNARFPSFLLFLLFLLVPSLVSAGKIVAPSSITLYEAAGKTMLDVSLSAKPLASVMLKVESDCLKLSACTMIFTTLNWNSKQKLTAYLAVESNVTCCDIKVSAVGDVGYLNAKATVKVCKDNIPPSVGSSWGDPHMVSLDGRSYSALSVGDFYLMRQFSGEFVAQVRQSKCGGASCNTALAVKYRNTVVFVHIGSSGTPTVSIYGNITQAGVQATKVGNVVTISSPNLASLKATFGLYQGVYYMSITYHASQMFKNQMAGLCGFFDGSSSNDLRLPNGAQASTDAEFNLGWKVAAAENLFLNATAKIPPIFGASPPSSSPPSFGRVCRPGGSPLLGDLSAIATVALSPLRSIPVPSGPPQTVDCDSIVASLSPLHIAKTTCALQFALSSALWCENNGISSNVFLRGCVCDFVLSGDATFALQSQLAYLNSCEVIVKAKGILFPF